MKLKYKTYIKEKVYLGILIVFGLLSYTVLFIDLIDDIGFKEACIFSIIFLLICFFIILLGYMVLAGVIKGNSVKASPVQFKEVFKIVNEQAEALGLKKVPKVYVLQHGGFINAFIAKFARKHYVVLFAPVVAEAYKEGEDTLRFIIGHELGHIKRNHLAFWKVFLTFPATFIPFLGAAYSRACEYTCDSIGYALSPSGALKGMGLLAVGPELYKKLDMEAWMSDSEDERGFATFISELFSPHPHLSNRVQAIHRLQKRGG